MHASYELRALAITVVVLQQQLAGLLVKRRLGIRVDEEALDRHKDMPDTI